jgi:hypothetical protein
MRLGLRAAWATTAATSLLLIGAVVGGDLAAAHVQDLSRSALCRPAGQCAAS